LTVSLVKNEESNERMTGICGFGSKHFLTTTYIAGGSSLFSILIHEYLSLHTTKFTSVIFVNITKI